MKKPEYSSQGFSLLEIVISMGILSVVILGGMRVLDYFNSETKKEASKMGDLSEFNQLTKDFLKFTEGAGISTIYLNLPIKVNNCEDNEPCIRKQIDQNFVAPESSDLTSAISKNTCIQFYKDGKGVLETRRAYPNKTKNDILFEVKNTELNADLKSNLVATWPLIDTKSAPIVMMKTRETSVVLNYLRGTSVETSRKGNSENVKYAFFESNISADQLQTLKGYPFLIYNSLYNNHFIIQYAKDIIACGENSSQCKKIIKDISGFSPTDAQISADLEATYPSKVYAIHFEEISFNDSFFNAVKSQHQIPENCKSSWGNGKQSKENYFFPSKAFSVSEQDSEEADLGGTDAVNVLHLSHYYTGSQVNQDIKKGLMVAVPIDILNYKIEQHPNSRDLQLVSELWHATDKKKKVKISQLKGPFYLTRKIGSPEMGIWYNPVNKNKGIGL